MEKILESLEKYKYNSLQYVALEDIADAKICMNTEDNLFLYQKSNCSKELYWTSKSKENIQLHWAAQSKKSFFEGLNKTINHIRQTELETEMLYIEFIPEEFLNELADGGFKIASEWVDFWKRDLNLATIELRKHLSIRPLEKNEIQAVSKVTRSCAEYSRGFTGESEEVMKEWFEKENSCLLVAELDGNIVGVGYFVLYGFDSEKGTVLWVRELAVDPAYQSKGIGRELISHGILWGRNNGAKRSFLACDAENYNAIKLYESLEYSRNNERGQINMELLL
jgi:predicted N-acetyltransferase YhbS